MNKKICFTTVLMTAIFAGVIFNSCKKDEDVNPASMLQLSVDENDMQSSIDDVANDVSDIFSLTNEKTPAPLPCNVSIDTVSIENDTITLKLIYNGDNCEGNLIREGVVYVKKAILVKWKDQGASVKIELENLKITRKASGRYITLNGTKNIVNISGGRVLELGNGSNEIIHNITGEITAKFQDNTTRIWNIARKRTFTGKQDSIIVSTEGFGNASGYNNLVIWGKNRDGEDFYTQINEPVVHKQACNWDPTSGVKIHQIPSQEKKATITFGFDANNQLITNGDCPERFKIDWEKGEKSGTVYKELR